MPWRFSWQAALAFTVLGTTAACTNAVQITRPARPGAILARRVSYDAAAYHSDEERYERASNEDTQRQIRDKIAYSLMAEIDVAYGEYTSNLMSGRGATALLSDTLQLGLTAGATLAAPARTKTILSAIATGLTGVNLSFDKNFFAEQTTQTIVIGMETKRDKTRQQIYERLRNNAKEYPLAAARRDLIQYFYAGTLVGGLQELQEDAQREKPTANPPPANPPPANPALASQAIDARH